MLRHLLTRGASTAFRWGGPTRGTSAGSWLAGMLARKPEMLVTVAVAPRSPALLDVVTARQELAMLPKLGAKQAAEFSLWVARAVLDRRSTEVVDLARTNLLR